MLKKIRHFVCFFLFLSSVYSTNLYIGKGSYGSPNVVDWGEGTKCVIGNYCSLAHNILIQLGGNHRIDWVTTYPFPALRASASHIKNFVFTKGDVVIGNDVWIGDGACILSGVKIGNGAVIGARSVVSKDIPPYAIAVGNPARVVKYRFNDVTIQKLESIAWWDWDDALIDQTMDLLLSNNIELFINYCEEHGLLPTSYSKTVSNISN